MAQKFRGPENLEEARKTKNYILVDPLDYLVLEVLPDEGELVMGFYPLAKTVDQLRKEKFHPVSPGSLSAQLRNMRLQGLVTDVYTAHSHKGRSYQRTKEGKRVYDDWKKKNTKSAPDTSGGE